MKPFVKSMLIWNENTYRGKIGLETLFEDKIMQAIPHSKFYNLVSDGARNPLFEWESKFGSHERAC